MRKILAVITSTLLGLLALVGFSLLPGAPSSVAGASEPSMQHHDDDDDGDDDRRGRHAGRHTDSGRSSYRGCDFSGAWFSDYYGRLSMRESRSVVKGRYERGNGRIEGLKRNGHFVEGTWSRGSSQHGDHDSGWFTFAIRRGSGCDEIVGYWGYGDHPDPHNGHRWELRRIRG